MLLFEEVGDMDWFRDAKCSGPYPVTILFSLMIPLRRFLETTATISFNRFVSLH